MPHATYFVDAVPTPAWWGGSSRGIDLFMRRYTKELSLFASSNPWMLEYQRNYISSSCAHTTTLYTPSSDEAMTIGAKTEPSEPVFLYTGSLYGLRTPKYIFEAFRRFLVLHPNAELRFVGTNVNIINSVSDEIKNNVTIVGFTKDLTPHYAAATALIDVDANCDNDIFLSSKITNYLRISRPIICETGANSPTRNLFSKTSGVFVCRHNADDIFEAMIKCCEQYEDFDRKEECQLFNPEVAVRRFFAEIVEAR